MIYVLVRLFIFKEMWVGTKSMIIKKLFLWVHFDTVCVSNHFWDQKALKSFVIYKEAEHTVTYRGESLVNE